MIFLLLSQKFINLKSRYKEIIKKNPRFLKARNLVAVIGILA